jgi:hypothetical protein
VYSDSSVHRGEGVRGRTEHTGGSPDAEHDGADAEDTGPAEHDCADDRDGYHGANFTDG